MTDNRLLDLVDARDFRTLFIDELGWENPNQPDTSFDVDGHKYTFSQVAGYKGMRIWHCADLPPRKIQRALDVLVGQSNQERLLIFTSPTRQDWRWPRRAQLGGTNAKLLAHEHVVGDRNTHLTQRLKAIELDFDENVSLVALLEKMRDAFDQEAETASVAAARLMGTLYSELEVAGVVDHDATLLLARLLFLLFGDDAGMWEPENLFETFLRENTADATLHADLIELFVALDTDERRRNLPAGSPYTIFRYVNGGLFHDQLPLPALTTNFRTALLEACEFDWSVISPAVFGSMFQTVKSKEARRGGGEHYTTEENILKTIRPLFLDEYRDRLDRAWDNKAQLTKLHNELGKLRFLDPACGCGNFLIVAYRELRALELELLIRRRDLDIDDTETKKLKVDRTQMTLDVTDLIRVTLDNFYGIEIEEWPARIAETAMLLVDHLANQRMTLEFGVAPDRLPIEIAPTIRHANAVEVDWTKLVPRTDGRTIVLGNPPFVGHRERKDHIKRDLSRAWGANPSGALDYVTAWHAKSLELLADRDGEFAFVTTNSIAQGQGVQPLFGAIFAAGWRIKFAHRTFKWTSEATGPAGVHCVIIGFTRDAITQPRLWDYETISSPAKEVPVLDQINAYLLDRPNVLVTPRTRPLSPQVAEVNYGTMPCDNGNLLINTVGEYEKFMADPVAARYVRPFVGSKVILSNK
ncbi:class I SAM-dependent DNA methyltransferase, partial [Hoyosella altamirensis]